MKRNPLDTSHFQIKLYEFPSQLLFTTRQTRQNGNEKHEMMKRNAAASSPSFPNSRLGTHSSKLRSGFGLGSNRVSKLILEVNGHKLTRFAKGGGSYLSAGDQRIIFGLAKSAKSGKLTIEWPTGEPRTEHWNNLAINQYHRLIQGRGGRK
jgi:hypothetical protein